MARAAFIVLAVLAIAPQVAAQGPRFPAPKTPPPNNTVRDQEYAITAQGCLRGRRFVVDGSANSATIELIQASEFALEGSKELLQRLEQEHDNHYDEITGIAIVPVRQREGSITEINDKTRIVVSSRGKSSDDVDVKTPKVLRFKVTSLTHLEDKCPIRG
jgi:hypothetical protein